MPLTDDAKAELDTAFKIVREDKFEAYARTRISKLTTPKEADKPKETDPLITEKEKETVDPPPKKEGEKENEAPPKRNSLWWGETED